MYFLYKLRWSLNVPNHILAQWLVYDKVFMLVKEKGTNFVPLGEIVYRFSWGWTSLISRIHLSTL
jgi:hypothetical protein